MENLMTVVDRLDEQLCPGQCFFTFGGDIILMESPNAG